MFSLVLLLLYTQVYESASTNRFHHGRTETIRTATSESLALARLLSVSSHVLLYVLLVHSRAGKCNLEVL
jgi:Choline/Carnitine o-acyltransferase